MRERITPIALCHRHARKVDVRLPEEGDSNSHGARPVHLIITMMQWVVNIELSLYAMHIVPYV